MEFYAVILTIFLFCLALGTMLREINKSGL